MPPLVVSWEKMYVAELRRRLAFVSQFSLIVFFTILIPVKSGINEINWLFQKCILPNNCIHSHCATIVFQYLR